MFRAAASEVPVLPPGDLDEAALDALASYVLPMAPCGVECDEGSGGVCGGSTFRHTYGQGDGDWTEGDPADSCFFGSCAGHFHTKCAMTFADGEMEKIYAAATNLDGRRLLNFISVNEGRAWFNSERGALQVAGCNGLGASIPLTADVIALLD